jgi:hypothetical protein
MEVTKLKRGESVGGSLPVVSNTQYQMNQSSVPPMLFKSL